MSIDLPGRVGFGTAPLGNMYRAIPEQEALATVHAAWDQGIRYFDAAPLYGAGLAELRLGQALQHYPRDAYVLSTKVGRRLLDETENAASRDLGEKGGLFEHGLPNKIVYDYSADGTLRTIEESLRRLKTDRLDIVWIHDPAKDFHGENWRAVFHQAMSGAAGALTRPYRCSVNRTGSAVLRAPSLRMAARRCTATVRGVIPSAIGKSSRMVRRGCRPAAVPGSA